MTEDQQSSHTVLKTANWWVNTKHKMKSGNCYGLNFVPPPQIHILKSELLL